MLNSKQIMAKTGIGSMKTLTRWHQRGLIPPPEIKTHPNGRGKIAYWPDWVLRRIVEVQQLLKKGLVQDEVVEQLGSDWEAEAKRLIRRRYKLRRALENDRRQKARENYLDAIENKIFDYLRAIGIQRPGGFSKVPEQFGTTKHIKQVLDLVRQGFNPVAVIVGDRVKVTADISVVDVLSSTESCDQPLLVVPLRKELLDAYTEVEQELPNETKFQPAQKVLSRHSGKQQLVDYKVDGKWLPKIIEK